MNQRNTADASKVKRKHVRKQKARKDFHVIQIRVYPEAFERFETARDDTAIINRSEFCRVLIDEALKARGF